MLAGNEAKLANLDETAHRAQLDIQGVIDCDVYVICSDNEKADKGMYVELGAALALHETTGVPRIYLVGKMNHMSVFYFHSAVTRVDTIEDVLGAIN
jgi:nucleoside 2-deoxyribosyltransferase